MNSALRDHAIQLTKAHEEREADWKRLAENWKKYEEISLEENHRYVHQIRKQLKLWHVVTWHVLCFWHVVTWHVLCFWQAPAGESATQEFDSSG